MPQENFHICQVKCKLQIYHIYKLQHASTKNGAWHSFPKVRPCIWMNPLYNQSWGRAILKNSTTVPVTSKTYEGNFTVQTTPVRRECSLHIKTPMIGYTNEGKSLREFKQQGFLVLSLEDRVEFSALEENDHGIDHQRRKSQHSKLKKPSLTRFSRYPISGTLCFIPNLLTLQCIIVASPTERL